MNSRQLSSCVGNRLWSRTRIAAGLIAVALCVAPASGAERSGPYRADWDSLARHPMPEWLLDAKFGIYAHWGVYSVPAYQTEWYARRMYERGTKFNEHHTQKWGPIEKFGYKDFIPLFKAERYDAQEWARLIAASGARYAGLAVVHHDGFLLWDSAISKWNAKQMGPKRDVYGELVAALRNRGLKTIATEHHIRTFNWYLPGTNGFGEGDISKIAAELRDQKLDLTEPAYADLYSNAITSTYDEFMTKWRAKLHEVIDKYQPDILWFDGGNFRGKATEKTVLEVLAHYHNQAAARGQQVEVLNKLPGTMKFNFPENYGILTFEEGRDRGATVPRPWIDDMKISDIGWGYVEGQKYKGAGEILAGLVDRVARGGGLLLNLSPQSDGTIPEEQKNALAEVGTWLKVNGEAIYGTRPWTVHAEGDESKLRETGAHPKWKFTNCDASDIRFTRPKNGGTVYAIPLAWPAGGAELTIKSVNARTFPGTIARVTLLGRDGDLKFARSAEGLRVTLPPPPAGESAARPFALKIVPQ